MRLLFFLSQDGINMNNAWVYKATTRATSVAVVPLLPQGFERKVQTHAFLLKLFERCSRSSALFLELADVTAGFVIEGKSIHA